MTSKVYFSFGSNLGDREANILKAIDLLSKALGTRCRALSSIIETDAWGFDGPPFLNSAACFDSNLDPHDILLICKEIERTLGRNETLELDDKGKRVYHSRPIDIDILLYGDKTVDLPDLKIPHPLMQSRPFVMGPLKEIIDG